MDTVRTIGDIITNVVYIKTSVMNMAVVVAGGRESQQGSEQRHSLISTMA